jgi:four helix bundle protein
MSNYQTLDAWKESMMMVKEIYLVTKKFPKEEQYGLTSQTKRAAVSVPSNIAEGMGRQYKKDTIQFLHVARGSIYELETLLNIAVMTEMIDQNIFSAFVPMLEKITRLLNGLINYLEKSKLK